MRPSIPTNVVLVVSALCAPAPAALSQVILHEVSGDAVGDQFGASVGYAGDVNADGVPDFVAGSPQDDDNGSASGSVRAHSGLDGSTLFTWFGDAANDQFGAAVSTAGDVNGDGHADVLAGAPRDDNNGLSSSGMVRVFSGQGGGVLYQFDGAAKSDRLGSSVSCAGDVDNDGFPDFIVGAIKADTVNGSDSGEARVYSGQTGSLIHHFLGDVASSEMGRAVSGGLDLNLDGRPDLVVGIYRDDAFALNAGRVRAFSGATGAALWSVGGLAASDLFGWSVGMVADANGDGRADVVVGAPFHSSAGAIVNGVAQVLSGQNGGVLHSIVGLANGDQFGSSVSGAGDIDGDGRGDFVIGADHAAINGSSSGSVTAYSGADGSILVHDDGPSGSASLGFAVAPAGDVNGDGKDDFIASADDLATDGGSGTVRVYSGCLGGITEYGAGCPGASGQPLGLSLSGCPEPAGVVSLGVSDGPSGGSALVFLGLGEGALPMGGGCVLLVAPLLPPVLVLPLSAAGEITVPGAIPLGVGGISITLQAFSADLGVPGGFYNSNGVRFDLP